MTLADLDRWDAPGAPVVLRAEVEDFAEGYFREIWARFGISRDAYLIVARDAVKEARGLFEAKQIVARNSTLPKDDAKREPGLARWSTILGSFERLLQDYGRKGWAVLWGSIVKLGKTFGTNVRAAWERVRMLREAGLLKVWHRWKGEEHDYDEGRSNIGFLMVPLEIFEWWITLPRARRLLASLEDAGSELGFASPPAGPAPRLAPPSMRAQSTRPAPARKAERATSAAAPESLPTFFPALFHEVRGADPRYQGEDERAGGTMKAENAVACESVFLDEAAAARAFCEKLRAERGAAAEVPVPDIDVLARELARTAVRAWLKETGKDEVLPKRRHAMGLLFFDVVRLAAAARTRWQERLARRVKPAEPVAPRDEPRFSVPAPQADDAAEEGEADSMPPETPEQAAEARLAAAEFRAKREAAAGFRAKLGMGPNPGATGEPPAAPD